jgi:hypothetical protein
MHFEQEISVARTTDISTNSITDISIDSIADTHTVTISGWRTLRESLISEIFVSTSEKIWQVFLLNASAFRDFLIFRLHFQIFFLHSVLHPAIYSIADTHSVTSDSMADTYTVKPAKCGHRTGQKCPYFRGNFISECLSC